MNETVRLRVVQEYRAGGLYYAAGSIIEVPAEAGAWLRRDAPGCFEEMREEGAGAPGDKGLEGPAADKMLRRPGRKK